MSKEKKQELKEYQKQEAKRVYAYQEAKESMHSN